MNIGYSISYTTLPVCESSDKKLLALLSDSLWFRNGDVCSHCKHDKQCKQYLYREKFFGFKNLKLSTTADSDGQK